MAEEINFCIMAIDIIKMLVTTKCDDYGENSNHDCNNSHGLNFKNHLK